MLSRFEEKRRLSRIEIRWPVTIITEKGPVEGEARNISAEGVFILFMHSSENLTPNKNYPLLLHHAREKIELMGKLVWSKLDIVPMKGFCFVEISEGQRELLRKAIQKHGEK